MTDTQIRFDDGAAYETMMGIWSRSVGEKFLDWLGPDLNQRWVDVGCGNGAFSDLAFERTSPSHLFGVDPSEAQLAYARQRLAGHPAEFVRGDAMALPLEDRTYDIAVMALVIFFVPQPSAGVAEMKRAVRPGGTVAAYAWNINGGGLPAYPILSELPSMGLTAPTPPNPGAADTAALIELWRGAGLRDVDTCEISVQRTFESFDEYWKISCMTGPIAMLHTSLSGEQAQELKSRVQRKLQPDSTGRIVCHARANAIRGTVPA